MKKTNTKITYLILFILLSFFWVISPLASSSFNTTLTTNKANVKVGDTLNVSVNLSGLDALGLGAGNFIISFDSDLFQYVSTGSASNVTANLIGSTVKLAVLDSTGGENPKSNGVLETITFKAKSNVDVSSVATFGITSTVYRNKNGDSLSSNNTGINVTVYKPSTNANLTSLIVSGESLSPVFNENTTNYTVSTTKSSISINATGDSKATISGLGNKNLAYGSNKFTIIVTAEANNSKTYNIDINRIDNRNTNSSLSSIKLSYGSINFNSNTTTYNIDLPSSINALTVTAEASDYRAKVTYNPSQTINLDYGQKKPLLVTVTAENGAQTTYTINVTRGDDRSTDNNLKSLTVSNTNIKFNKSNNYVETVENTISEININATANDSKATVKGAGIKQLKDGSNIFQIEVTAENGSKKVYIITIIRKSLNSDNLSSNNYLSELAVEGFELIFDKEILGYDFVTYEDIGEIVVTYKAEDEKSVVIFNGETSLKEGLNQIVIIVTAENGQTREYTINIYKDSKRNIVKNEKETILNAIENNNNFIVQITLDEKNPVIDKDIIEALKNGQKNVTYEIVNPDRSLLYSITINGQYISDNINEINLGLKFVTNFADELKEFLKLKDALILNFAHSGELPKNTKIRVFVGDKFNSQEGLYLYYYDENLNEVQLMNSELLVVVDGYVEFSINHASEYFLTNKIVSQNDMKILTIFIISGVILVAATIVIVVCIRKKKQSKKVEVPALSNHEISIQQEPNNNILPNSSEIK